MPGAPSECEHFLGLFFLIVLFLFQVRIAVVGAGSGSVLEEAGEGDALRPAFTPSKVPLRVHRP
jgi:hypothetical protein